eukprot:CAMPEP_0178752494 /NCGR_PEP_ID=MMETSP0744-20121128/11094_1 /TAXON_ID=913974 /ORGANISM="Nitzschia punctata, Strain CCMP561" /LENGTH=328 /DNA_ID=CAMNT_0020406219 /DNA_START=167 /DNA_END=1150 /DNA_ORIENTATION=-
MAIASFLFLFLLLACATVTATTVHASSPREQKQHGLRLRQSRRLETLWSYDYCVTSFNAADNTTLDGMLDFEEYGLWIGYLAQELYNNSITVLSFFDLPQSLQDHYTFLARLDCFTTTTTITNTSTATTTSGGSVTTINTTTTTTTTIQNITGGCDSGIDLNMELSSGANYLETVCDTTYDAMIDAWGDPSSSATAAPEVTGRDVCPVDFPAGLDCSEYEPNLRCDYDYAFHFCSWEELECLPLASCDCTSNEWLCLTAAMAPCGFDGQPVPDGLPWGQSCDPTAPLPSEPVSGRDVCPSDMPLGESCVDYLPQLQCNYEYTYTGCTW